MLDLVRASRLAGLAALALLLAPGRAVANDPAGPPLLTAVVGVVEVLPDGEREWRTASAGLVLAPGDAVRTGPRAKAEVTHAAGTIRLFEHTLIRLPKDALMPGATAIRRVELLAGQSLFAVARDRLGAFFARASLGAASLFEVATPRVVAGVKGTEFAVSEGPERSVVAVYTGLVETTDVQTGSRSALLGAGEAAAYSDGGLSAVDVFDGKRGPESWSDPQTHAAPGLRASTGDPTGPAKAAETARFDASAERGGKASKDGAPEGGRSAAASGPGGGSASGPGGGSAAGGGNAAGQGGGQGQGQGGGQSQGQGRGGAGQDRGL